MEYKFEAKTDEVLNIVVNSLYTDKEIFVRELVSNASDALEKLKHIFLTNPDLADENLPLEINITTNKEDNTLIISDTALGMDKDELINNLGQIAHSGSKAFINALKEKGDSSSSIIGQFGVGFYSVFMVANEVEFYTLSYKNGSTGYCWKSQGKGSYEIEEAQNLTRGSKIVIKLKEEFSGFSEADTVKSIIEKYSSFIDFPVNINGEKLKSLEPLWLKNKKDISKEEYDQFYKFQAHAYDEPFDVLHFSADVPLSINAVLFTPSDNPEKFSFGKIEKQSVALYCKKVLIDPNPKNLLPEYMRFLKGVIDSADLPLNISRESMQDSALLAKIGNVVANRYIKHLLDMAKKKQQEYNKYWKNFGIFIKEGICAQNVTNKDKLAKLLRFESSSLEKGELTSLEEYVSRMSQSQEQIYFIEAPDRQSIEEGPYIDAFKKRGLEVLFMYESADSWTINTLGKFEEKQFVSIDSENIKLDDLPSDENDKLTQDEASELCKWVEEVLTKDKVQKVEVSKRLENAPALALNPEGLTSGMRRIMKAFNENAPQMPIILQLNIKDDLIKKLFALKSKNEPTAKLIAEQIFDNSMLLAGLMENPRNIANKMNKILSDLL